MTQTVLTAEHDYIQLDTFFQSLNTRRVFLVCDQSLEFLTIRHYFEKLEDRLGITVVKFGDFQPNPQYESVEKGVQVFNSGNFDVIVAVGGGSAMDVAKCIKLYHNMDKGICFLEQSIIPNDIPFLAIPTTAGTGSEATRYAVVYYHGEKQSISHPSCIPTTVLFDQSVLKTLPLYQRKTTALDALCHAVEAFWSINSTEESRQYSRQAIQMILTNLPAYLYNEEAANAGMLDAANKAGKAINITQTTAGHAMSYKLTSLFGIAHGHAVALCDRALFPWMISHTDRCIDRRGKKFLQGILLDIAMAFDCKTPEEASQRFRKLIDSMELSIPIATPEQVLLLETSVNPVRLKNHPILLAPEDISELYHAILNP